MMLARLFKIAIPLRPIASDETDSWAADFSNQNNSRTNIMRMEHGG
jgi:hypothetical protein